MNLSLLVLLTITTGAHIKSFCNAPFLNSSPKPSIKQAEVK